MAIARNLDPNRFSLSELAEETLYTQLVIEHTPECKALLADAVKLHSDVLAAVAQEQKLAIARTAGDVQVSLANRRLDLWVAALRATLHHRTHGQIEHPLYQRFFSRHRPSGVIRMALATELPVVEPWLESLKADPDAELAALGAELAKIVSAGRAAISTQAAARQAQRDFAAGPRLALFSQVNAGRAAQGVALRAIQDDVTWLESFFRQPPKRAHSGEEEPSVEQAQALVASKEHELASARAQLAAAQMREQAEQAQAAARLELEREREAKKKELAALAARLAELEGELSR